MTRVWVNLKLYVDFLFEPMMDFSNQKKEENFINFNSKAEKYTENLGEQRHLGIE